MLIISPAQVTITFDYRRNMSKLFPADAFQLSELQLVYIENKISFLITDLTWLLVNEKVWWKSTACTISSTPTCTAPPSFQPSSCPCIGRDLSSDCHQPHLDLVVWHCGNKRRVGSKATAVEWGQSTTLDGDKAAKGGRYIFTDERQGRLWELVCSSMW